MTKFLIVGLGNIGIEYVHTRHNIGFDVVDAFVIKHGGVYKTDRLAEVADVKFKGRSVICIKPSTFMNLSGRAFKYYTDKEKLLLENTLTVVDDIALPITKLRLRPGGSDAGHNGLKSIQESMGSDKYPKLRFGIGNNYAKGAQISYVLGKWNNDELAIVEKKIAQSVETIENFIFIGISTTMNAINNWEVI